MRKFLFGLAPLMVMVVFIVSGVMAGAASAAFPPPPPPYCAEATEPLLVGNWEKRTPNAFLGGECEKEVPVGTGKFVKIVEITKYLNATEACAEAEQAATDGNYEDAECTKKVVVGKGKFLKVFTAGAACTEFVLCGSKNEKLRDDATEPPEKGGYGMSGLAVNTAGILRFSAVNGVRVFNENPKGYAFFGVKLVKNEATSTTVCHKATGFVTFVDIQNAATGKKASPVYDNTEKAWPIEVKSDNTGCLTAERGEVKVEGVGLYFPELGGIIVTGTFTGKWVQPGACPGGSGGIELATAQSGVLVNGKAGAKAEVDNGTTGKSAFICFVSANNYLYPKTAPTWRPSVGDIWKD